MKGEEFKDEWGSCVLKLYENKELNTIYFMDELFFVDELPKCKFKNKFKPTGRVNKALKNLFNEENFERKEE